MFCQFGKHLYVMVRRLPNRFICECSAWVFQVFVCGFLVWECICTSKRERFHKHSKISFTDSFGNHLTITYIQLWQVGNLANVIKNQIVDLYKNILAVVTYFYRNNGNFCWEILSAEFSDNLQERMYSIVTTDGVVLQNIQVAKRSSHKSSIEQTVPTRP